MNKNLWLLTLCQGLFLTHGVTFIASHASLDAQHMAELRQVLNQDTDGAAGQAVVESTHVNFHHLTRIVEAV